MLNSVELVLVSAPDPRVASEFYVTRLGFRSLDVDETGATVQLGAMQIVIQRGAAPAGPGPVVHVRVPMETLERVWEEDRRADPGRAGPRLIAGGSFEYRTIDPAGNVVRLKTQVPSSMPGTGARLREE
ncbi:MAG: hypothetical protein KF901_27435 [Myxococcales bacterium]|nr:hypothetical protein [Myxococcales bacterium]